MTEQLRIPVTIIGGFLGAGKTTLVNHLIRQQPYHFGVIVNEFGKVGVDGGLIEAVRQDEYGLDISELTAGCLCCSGRDDLLRALVMLAMRPERPQHVLIELSGVADPVPVLATLLEPQVRAAFAVGTLVAVADAKHLRRTLQENREGARQLAYAGVVVLNKVGEVSEEEASAASDMIHALNPLATVWRSEYSAVDASALLSRQDFSLEALERVVEQAPALGDGLGHTPGLKSFSLRVGTLDPYRWQGFLREYVLTRPAEVLRVKGYLSIAQQPGRILFQAVRDVFSAERLGDDQLGGSDSVGGDSAIGDSVGSHSAGVTELVFIGLGLDKAEYEQALTACEVTTEKEPTLTERT